MACATACATIARDDAAKKSASPSCTLFAHSQILQYLINGGTELFTFEYKIANILICGCISAGTSYFLSMILNDFGLKITKGDDHE